MWDFTPFRAADERLKHDRGGVCGGGINDGAGAGGKKICSVCNEFKGAVEFQKNNSLRKHTVESV